MRKNQEVNNKTTVILTTHDIGDIEELCNRIIIIDEGRKIYDGGLQELKDTYGKTRKVTMELRQVKEAEKINWTEKLGTTEDKYQVTTDEEKNQLTITFEKNEIQISDIIAAIMEVTEVKDIQIQETELAEIVKEIYNHQFQAEDAAE